MGGNHGKHGSARKGELTTEGRVNHGKARKSTERKLED